MNAFRQCLVGFVTASVLDTSTTQYGCFTCSKSWLKKGRMYKARLPGLRSAPPLALGWELEPQGTFKMVTCLVLLKQIVIVKKINKENYKYPLFSREKKRGFGSKLHCC